MNAIPKWFSDLPTWGKIVVIVLVIVIVAMIVRGLKDPESINVTIQPQSSSGGTGGSPSGNPAGGPTKQTGGIGGGV